MFGSAHSRVLCLENLGFAFACRSPALLLEKLLSRSTARDQAVLFFTKPQRYSQPCCAYSIPSQGRLQQGCRWC